ncbi:hypothetical protein AKJ16_DCAP23151 [Drosera capensis]
MDIVVCCKRIDGYISPFIVIGTVACALQGFAAAQIGQAFRNEQGSEATLGSISCITCTWKINKPSYVLEDLTKPQSDGQLISCSVFEFLLTNCPPLRALHVVSFILLIMHKCGAGLHLVYCNLYQQTDKDQRTDADL